MIADAAERRLPALDQFQRRGLVIGCQTKGMERRADRILLQGGSILVSLRRRQRLGDGPHRAVVLRNRCQPFDDMTSELGRQLHHRRFEAKPVREVLCVRLRRHKFPKAGFGIRLDAHAAADLNARLQRGDRAARANQAEVQGLRRELIAQELIVHIGTDDKARRGRAQAFKEAMGAAHRELMDAAARVVEALPFGFVKTNDDEPLLFGLAHRSSNQYRANIGRLRCCTEG
jgi:hypothetical protein